MEALREKRIVFVMHLWCLCVRALDGRFTIGLHGDTNYQLPDGPVKAGRRWGQRHPQGANLGSNGRLKQVPVQAQTIGCHQPTLNPLLANVCQASPFRLAMR